ncbi:hypothetical protein L3Q82_005214 [Scortum barcoo]|uniref:Uncharacterized protein n=1 Tax=Scortum barcoo TaxID=214431 RepID=A0ACB8V9V5_9TELE|nr:hypothetical protein L3Q82_005214 [Scortum barcoo]
MHIAYRKKRSTEDAISSVVLWSTQPSPSHLENKDSYVRLLFVDFTSAFNTVILQNPGPETHNTWTEPLTLCNWVLDFLTDRPQSVRIHDVSSSSITLSTGSPQGCVLSPLLFTLLTYDCSAIHPSCLIVKFADDTAVVGRIANNDESDYRQEVEQLEGLVQTKQPLHQREEDQGDDRGLQKGQTPPLSPVHRRDCGGSGLQLQEAEARRDGELSPDLLLQMCGGERPVLLHHRVARQLLGGREEGSAEGGRRLRSIKSRTTRLRNSFFPEAVLSCYYPQCQS